MNQRQIQNLQFSYLYHTDQKGKLAKRFMDSASKELGLKFSSNELKPLHGGQQLTCAQWSTSGIVEKKSQDKPESEATSESDETSESAAEATQQEAKEYEMSNTPIDELKESLKPIIDNLPANTAFCFGTDFNFSCSGYGVDKITGLDAWIRNRLHQRSLALATFRDDKTPQPIPYFSYVTGTGSSQFGNEPLVLIENLVMKESDLEPQQPTPVVLMEDEKVEDESLNTPIVDDKKNEKEKEWKLPEQPKPFSFQHNDAFKFCLRAVLRPDMPPYKPKAKAAQDSEMSVSSSRDSLSSLSGSRSTDSFPGSPLPSPSSSEEDLTNAAAKTPAKGKRKGRSKKKAEDDKPLVSDKEAGAATEGSMFSGSKRKAETQTPGVENPKEDQTKKAQKNASGQSAGGAGPAANR